ncbi:MAG: nucleotidyltransferase family protein [Ignavibacteria bacterium]|jgi:hypothetical protein
MTNLSEIINNLKAAKPELEQKCNISEIGIFGSYSRNEQNEKSDIDILIELNENIGLLKFIQIENLIKSIIGNNAEVVIKSDIRPELKDNILRETIFI